MPDLERYNQTSSTWPFSWGLRTEKRARNGSKSRITFSAKKEKKKRAHLQLSDGVSDLSRNSRVVGIEYRHRYPKVRARILDRDEQANYAKNE